MKTNADKTSNADMVTISRAEYEALRNEVSRLTKINDWLTEQLRVGGSRKFGSSSEKASEEVVGQLSLLFDEAETYAHIEEVEASKETKVAEHTRTKRHTGSVLDIAPANLPVVVTEHELSEDERICPSCGSTMVEIGTESRYTLEIIPATVQVREDRYHTYRCEKCMNELGDDGETHAKIVKPEQVPSLIPGGFASAAAVAWIMTQKFVMYSPLYRLEQEMKRQDIQLSRQTMSNWLIRCAEDWLTPVYNELHARLLANDIIHADETELQVLHEDGKPAQSKSYMWLFRTGRYAPIQIVLYKYYPNRSQANPKEFLQNFKGYLQTDGYSGYNAVADVTHVGCFAHLRRKFEDAVRALPKGKKTGAAVKGEAYCSKIFMLEERLRDSSPEERYTQRLAQEKPVLDEYLAWSEKIAAAQKSKLGIALTYLKNQWPSLTAYLQDGRLEISNNRAERSIKPFVMGRKNFLFANTPRGAQSSAVIYSLIETAKENGLDPYRYLKYILETAPRLSRDDSDWAMAMLPDRVPELCRVNTDASMCR